MTDNPPVDYSAFLLRMWREGDGTPWRAALQEVDGGTLMRFRDLEGLFEYLRKRAETSSSDDEPL
jgi:hypothetical protein